MISFQNETLVLHVNGFYILTHSYRNAPFGHYFSCKIRAKEKSMIYIGSHNLLWLMNKKIAMHTK